MILVATHIAEQDWRRVELGDDEVGRGVAINVGGDQSTRGLELDLIKAEGVADIFQGAIAAIAEDAELGAGGGFDNCGQVDPAIVVDVDGSEPPTAKGVFEGELHTLEATAYLSGGCNVTPQGQAGGGGVGDGDVHPTVFVVVEDGDADGGRQF